MDNNSYYDEYITLSSHKLNPHADQLLTLIRSFVGLSSGLKPVILEIGCNDGDFGVQLQSIGDYTGIEPAKDAFDIASRSGLDVINQYFTGDLVSELNTSHSHFDAIVCRHVLEHIEDPLVFVGNISELSGPSTFVFIEVPDFDFQVEHNDYSFWEEHLTYPNLFTLKNLFYRHGFCLVHSQTFWFTGRSLLCVFKKPEVDVTIDLRNKILSPETQQLQLRSLYSRNKDYLDSLCVISANIRASLERLSINSTLVLYGIGCRSMFLCQLYKLGGVISIAVDDSPSKSGAFVECLNLFVSSIEDIPRTVGTRYTFLLGVNGESEMSVTTKLKAAFPDSTIFSLLPPSALCLWNT